MSSDTMCICISRQNPRWKKGYGKAGTENGSLELDLISLAQGLVQIIPYMNVSWREADHEGQNVEQFIQELQNKADDIYAAKEKEFPVEEAYP